MTVVPRSRVKGPVTFRHIIGNHTGGIEMSLDVTLRHIEMSLDVSCGVRSRRHGARRHKSRCRRTIVDVEMMDEPLTLVSTVAAETHCAS